MELKEYFQTLWKWWWLILLCTFCAGAASFAISDKIPPVYEAQVLLMSNQSTNSGIADYSSLLGTQQVIETYRELFKTRFVLETVITRLDLPYSPGELAKHTGVDIIPNTQLLRLRVEDNNAQRAADIANEIVLTFLTQRSTEQKLQEIEGYEQILAEQMSTLEQAIVKAEDEIAQSRASLDPLTQGELAELQAYQSQQRVAYAQLLAGYLSIRTMKSQLLDLVVIEPALPPSAAVSPRKLFNTGIAVIGGCLIACAVAFVLEYLNDSLENADDIRDALSLSNLGTIPLVKAWQKNGCAHIKGTEWSIGEAFRILRINIQFANIDSTMCMLLVTSSEPREGKTSVVANLGAVMAQDGHKVLLVSADLRRPRLHYVFEVQNDRGLTSLLLNDEDCQSCIIETDIPNLYLLPSGPHPPNPSELLGSQRMARLIQEFQAFADIVLFDVPAVLTCADAMVLAAQMDRVVLVIDRRSTRREAAIQALEMLHNVDAKVLGGILNRARVRAPEYYHYSKNGESKKRLWKQWSRRK